MVIRICPRAPHGTLRTIVVGIIVVGFAVVGCMPGGATPSPSPNGTSAVAPTSGAIRLAPTYSATPSVRPAGEAPTATAPSNPSTPAPVQLDSSSTVAEGVRARLGSP